MIHLFTDFGLSGPYVGQIHAVLHEKLQSNDRYIAVIDLMHDAPQFNPIAAGYLLASLAPRMSAHDICVGVVDPGVGTDRRAIAIKADQRWFVGPDNGLFAVLPHVFNQLEHFEISWRPQQLSNSFHGRDIFAPVAAEIALGNAETVLKPISAIDGAEADLAEVIYIDAFGNAMTGISGADLTASSVLIVGGHKFQHATTFADQPAGTSIWYINSNGLLELSITRGNASDTLNLCIGDRIVQDL